RRRAHSDRRGHGRGSGRNRAKRHSSAARSIVSCTPSEEENNMRPLGSLMGLALALCLLAPAAFASNLEVEGPQDTLFGPPERPDVNHCTLRKAIGNANADSAPYPQCAAGSGADTITFLTYFNTVAFQLPGAGEDGNTTGDMDITQSLTITGPDT